MRTWRDMHGVYRSQRESVKIDDLLKHSETQFVVLA